MSKKKIAYLGAGTWGFSLARVLANNGHTLVVWTRNPDVAKILEASRLHPRFPLSPAPSTIRFTSDLDEALAGAECIVESLTASALRPIFQEIQERNVNLPIILTSKGIEQGTGLLLPEVLHQIFDQPVVGCLSGPSHAEEVIQDAPTSVVASSYDPLFIETVRQLFTTPNLRVYPNRDLHGVCFGGAMKNIIAIAIGIAEGMEAGANSKAALMTRGLHEIRRLSTVKNCQQDTLNGLAGLGDLCVTCLSPHSRNLRFGRLIGQGRSPQEALAAIGMAVEGMYSCAAARELGRAHQISLPITEAVYQVLYEGVSPREAGEQLQARVIREEHL